MAESATYEVAVRKVGFDEFSLILWFKIIMNTCLEVWGRHGVQVKSSKMEQRDQFWDCYDSPKPRLCMSGKKGEGWLTNVV